MRTQLHSRVPRLAAVALAATVVVVPVLVATPASAAPVAITAFTLPGDIVTYDGPITGYYNDDPDLTLLETQDMCQAIYVDGRSAYPPNPVGMVGVTMDWYVLTTMYQAVPGDVITLGYFAEDTTKPEPCEVPPMADITIKDSVTMGPAPVQGVEIAVEVPNLRFSRGAAVDMLLPMTAAAGFDWSEGGYIGAGGSWGGDEETGYIDPLDGLVFEPLHVDEPGAAPMIRVSGIPKFSGSTLAWYELGDGVNYGYGRFTIEVADPTGVATPITIDLAAGQPVAGARVAIVTTGLAPRVAWTATVRSTPVVVGTGTTDFDGNLTAAVRIPTGLAAGIHSITVTSTRADGSAFAAVLYFRVSATGTLVAVYNSDPELAATGADSVSTTLLGGGSLVLAGFALAVLAARRCRRTA